MRFMVLVAVALFSTLPVASSNPVMTGTEDSPELEDPANNVVYSPAYVGSQDRGHVDVLAGWFEHVSENHTMMFTYKFTSLVDVVSTTQTWQLMYIFRAAVYNGQEDAADLEFFLEKEAGEDEWQGSAGLNAPQGRADIDFGFQTNFTEPGYMRWWVPMDTMQLWGIELRNLRAQASETQFHPSSPIINYNQASSSETFDYIHFEPAPANSTDDDDFLTPRSPESTSTTSAESVGVSLAASAAAVLIAVAFRAKRRT